MKALLARLLTCICLGIYVLPSFAAADDFTLLIFGDSLSAGYGLEEGQGWVNLLDARVASQELPYAVVNGSVSGETTTGGLARLPAMLDSYAPQVVLLELGANDGLRGLPLVQLRANLQQMIELSQAAGASVLLAGIQIPPNYGPRYTEPFFEIFAELALEYQLSLVPFLIDGIPQQPELMQNDGLHPKAEAQSMILDNVWPVLAPLLENGR